MENELTALAAPVGRGNRDLRAELIGLVGLALADAFDLWRMPGIKLGATLIMVLPADAQRLAQGLCEDLLQIWIVGDLARDVPDQPAEPRAQELQFAVRSFELMRMSITLGHLRRPLGKPGIGLPQLQPMGLGLYAQLQGRPQHQLGVRRMGHGLRLDRGVDCDSARGPDAYPHAKPPRQLTL